MFRKQNRPTKQLLIDTKWLKTLKSPDTFFHKSTQTLQTPKSTKASSPQIDLLNKQQQIELLKINLHAQQTAAPNRLWLSLFSIFFFLIRFVRSPSNINVHRRSLTSARLYFRFLVRRYVRRR